jgi:RNase P subunit RPR2
MVQFETNSTNCENCNKPLVWIGRSKRSHQGRDVYELDFRCDYCKREFRFRDGKLRELKLARDPLAEQIAIQRAEVDTVRNRRCLSCGGPLDDFLACERCSERYVIENGELVPRVEEPATPRRQMSEFYVLNEPP